MASSNSGKRKATTDGLYARALHLYRTTELSAKEICEQTETTLAGFKAYLYRHHRELMLARHGISLTAEEASETRLRRAKGQSRAAREKYMNAILACDDKEYIEYNVSQIAAIFHLDPNGLGQQLRSHYPEILERREKERHRLGINDNFQRGARAWCKEQYAEAVEHLRSSEDTIMEAAEKFNLSYTGLRGHLLYYHRSLVEMREGKRVEATGTKRIGKLTGNGSRHLPAEEQTKRYEDAVELYRTTAMTMKEIAAATGISQNGFNNYLRMWHIELMLERRGVTAVGNHEEALRTSKQYLKSAAEKYSEAIASLKESGKATAEVAKQYGLHPDCFREYLHEHEPALAARLGMKKLPNGRHVLARSAEKYSEAIHLYRTTTETLKSIAGRLGIKYNSIGGFIRRNHAEAIEEHNRLVEAERLSEI